MEATIIPSARADGAHGRVYRQGRLYRYRKPLSVGQFRWKCSRSGRNFISPGCAVTDVSPQGCRVVREGGHADHCETSAAAGDVASIRADVIAREGSFAATPPLRTDALSVAEASCAETHIPPKAAHLKRSAQNAAARKRKRANADGAAGFIANYKTSKTCPSRQAPLGAPTGSHSSSTTAGRWEIGYCCLGPRSTFNRYRTLKFGGPTGLSRRDRSSGPSCTLPARRLAGISFRVYTRPFRVNQRRSITGCGAQ